MLRALLTELPAEQFVYVADSGHAPYGERNDTHVIDRSHTVAKHLLTQHHIKALVVACNTATATAIQRLRAAYPELLLIGIEPALKPAAISSKTGVVGVMATRGTLQSEKFQALLKTLRSQATFSLQPCDGLAMAIENNNAIKIEAYCADYTRAMGRFGVNAGEMDTLVLGCTHYPFVAEELRKHIGPNVAMIEGGAPVARQTRRLLQGMGLLNTGLSANWMDRCDFFSTGETSALCNAAANWLMLDTSARPLSI